MYASDTCTGTFIAFDEACAALFAALFVTACGPRSELPKAAHASAPSASPAPVSSKAAQTHDARVADPVAAQAAADRAVDTVATQLASAEATCAQTWGPAEELCDARSFAEAVDAYQTYYGVYDDPRRDSGRIDALPRLGGVGESSSAVVARVAWMCADRCDAARRVGQGLAVDEAADRCVGGDRAACPSLAPRASQDLVDRCVARCAKKKRETAEQEAIERARPKTAAQAAQCSRACKARCPKGGFCGTCEVSCDARCAVAKK